MNYKIFKVTGKHKDTKRKRSLSLPAKTEQSAEQTAVNKGLVPPFEVEVVPHESPSDRQLEYAKGIGIEVPPNATAKDVSCLLSRYEENDSEPNQGLVEFADNRGMFFSQYIGKKLLYDLVFNELSGINKTAFFVFSIYRWLSEDRHASLDTHPDKELFYVFARQVETDAGFQKSMTRYQGSDLRFFGEITREDKDGYYSTYIGGSNRTIAYNKAATYISDTFGTKLTKNITVKNNNFTSNSNEVKKSSKHSVPITENTGCLLPLLIILVMLITVILV